jgi:hypothetical protein
LDGSFAFLPIYAVVESEILRRNIQS